jgi:hypothetical protein
MTTMRWDAQHQRTRVARAAAKDASGGWKLPEVWRRRAARLRRSASGALLRRPR